MECLNAVFIHNNGRADNLLKQLVSTPMKLYRNIQKSRLKSQKRKILGVSLYRKAVKILAIQFFRANYNIAL